MNTMNRRSVVRGTAWSVPVIALAATAPAFAVSRPICNVTAECKEPGAGQNTKDYRIRTNCGFDDSRIESVVVFKNESKTDFITAEPQGDGTFLAAGFKDSRAYRYVRITFNDGTANSDYNVAFPPC